MFSGLDSWPFLGGVDVRLLGCFFFKLTHSLVKMSSCSMESFVLNTYLLFAIIQFNTDICTCQLINYHVGEQK